MRVFRILALAAALAAALGAGLDAGFVGPAAALPFAAPASRQAAVVPEPVQVVCGPYRCFARPFWRYRSGAGFLPYRRFGFAPPPPRFAPFGFRRFGGYGGFGGGFGRGFGGRFGGYGGRPGGFRRF